MNNPDALARYHRLYNNYAYTNLRAHADSCLPRMSGEQPDALVVAFMNAVTNSAIATCHLVLGVYEQRDIDEMSIVISHLQSVPEAWGLHNATLDYLNLYNPTEEEKAAQAPEIILSVEDSI